jgi:hypothetical protein
MNKLFFGILLLICFSCKSVDFTGIYVYTPYNYLGSDTFFIQKNNTYNLASGAKLLDWYTTSTTGNWRKKTNSIILNTYTQEPIYFEYFFSVLASKFIASDSIFIYLLYEDKKTNLFKTLENCLFVDFSLKNTSNRNSILNITDTNILPFEYPNYPNAVKISLPKPPNSIIDTTKSTIEALLCGFNFTTINFKWLKNPNHNHFVIAFNTLGEPFINKKMRIKKDMLIETYTNPITKKKEKRIYKKVVL